MTRAAHDAPHASVPTEAHLADWIEGAVGLRPRAFESLAPGLGHRRFVRVSFGDEAVPPRLVLRIDPPEQRVAANGVPAEPELEPIRALLEAHGLPVPRLYARDPERGWDLLEDVGDRSLEKAAAEVDAVTRRRLYREAVDLVPRLQEIRAPSPDIAAFDRRLDEGLIATKADKVIRWLLPECLGRPARASERDVIERAFRDVARSVRAAPARLAHRDFKAANLHVLSTEASSAERDAASPAAARERLVMIDLQGAFLAPPEYDLVCLLRDSQVKLPEDEIQALLEHVRPQLPDAPLASELVRRFDQLTLTRVGKDLAHYLHAARDRGDTRYLGFVPHGLAQLRAAGARLASDTQAFGALAALLAELPRPAICESSTSEAPPCAP